MKVSAPALSCGCRGIRQMDISVQNHLKRNNTFSPPSLQIGAIWCLELTDRLHLHNQHFGETSQEVHLFYQHHYNNTAQHM